MTANKCGARSRSGFTLVEMLAVMAALSLALMLGGALLVGAFRAERTAMSSLDRLTIRATLEDQLRSDIGQASDLSDKAGAWQASPTCLILKTTPDKQVIYNWDGKLLQRHEVPTAAAAPRRVHLGKDVLAVAFSRAEANPRLILVRLTESLGFEKTRPVEISAALGGDLR